MRSERLKKEKRCGSGVIDLKNKTLYVENIPFIYDFFKDLLFVSGIYDDWHENALQLRIRHESWSFANLPESFDDFRILQISDIHIDALPELSDIIPALMQQVDFELCVLTGDFRFNIHCSNERIDKLLQPIIEAANQAEYPALGILGNHDYLDYTLDNVAGLGLKFLLNESMELKRGDDKILLTGLDDVHFYRTGRLFEQRDAIAEAGYKLLLIHSPEYIKEAALY
ncbi:MAG: metallophosphoesterase, partial [Candidatus Stygibacter australis]|nr:metallophosphoesterase [Candidatus Stygibacter australis]